MSEFDRIFTPRTHKAVKAISLLTNGTKYAPTQKEKDATLAVLKEAVNDIAQLYGMLPNGEVVVVPVNEAPKPKRSDFHHRDIDANVRSIPENQLSSYITHMLARMCDIHDSKK